MATDMPGRSLLDGHTVNWWCLDAARCPAMFTTEQRVTANTVLGGYPVKQRSNQTAVQSQCINMHSYTVIGRKQRGVKHDKMEIRSYRHGDMYKHCGFHLVYWDQNGAQVFDNDSL